MLLERDEEQRAVEDLLAATRSGAGQLLLVEGHAGIGKSALLDGARPPSQLDASEMFMLPPIQSHVVTAWHECAHSTSTSHPRTAIMECSEIHQQAPG